MKKDFETPELTILEFRVEDVVTTSGDLPTPSIPENGTGGRV